MNQAVETKVVTDNAVPIAAVDRGVFRDRLLMFALAVISIGAWYVGELELYKADSPLGYNLGLVGGIAMALLLLYPLRKRARWMRSIVPLKYWFGAHMALGIIGPVLIMYHSNFQFSSKNGTIAFFSMLAVFVSGLVGRVIYRRIHFGLFGRKATLAELKQRLGMNGESIHSRFHKLPKVEIRLQIFEDRATKPSASGLVRFYRAITMRSYARWTRYRCLSHLKRVIKKRGNKKNWPTSERKRRYQLGKEIINSYLEAVTKVAQFGVFERMFSFWHIAHVPLIFLLIVTASIHVLAVHLY